MSWLTFDRLLHVYRHTTFADADSGELTVADAQVLEVLNRLDENPGDARCANLAPVCDAGSLSIGSKVEVVIGAPQSALGVLAFDVDDLLKAPRACIQEPKRYYIANLRYSNDEPHSPALIQKYRSVCALVKLLADAAAFLDKDSQQVVFIGNGKFVLQIEYDGADLQIADEVALAELIGAFKEDSHREQRLAILAAAAQEITESKPSSRRFRHLLNNLSDLKQKFDEGYRLFTSSFSYKKIRGDMEATKVDYLGKIHKTFTDIQGHILAIPVATVVVATQMDVALDCTKYFWKNFSVLLGAWIFCFLLFLAAGNQWHTLKAISVDIDRQKEKMIKEHTAISSMFTDIFIDIEKRISWHLYVIYCVVGVAGIGAILATFAYHAMTTARWTSCVAKAAKLMWQ